MRHVLGQGVIGECRCGWVVGVLCFAFVSHPQMCNRRNLGGKILNMIGEADTKLHLSCQSLRYANWDVE